MHPAGPSKSVPTVGLCPYVKLYGSSRFTQRERATDGITIRNHRYQTTLVTRYKHRDRPLQGLTHRTATPPPPSAHHLHRPSAAAAGVVFVGRAEHLRPLLLRPRARSLPPRDGRLDEHGPLEGTGGSVGVGWGGRSCQNQLAAVSFSRRLALSLSLSLSPIPPSFLPPR